MTTKRAPRKKAGHGVPVVEPQVFCTWLMWPGRVWRSECGASMWFAAGSEPKQKYPACPTCGKAIQEGIAE